MRSTSLLVAAASVADALVVQPTVQLPPMLTSRVSAPSMQFGFQNYDRTVEKPNRDKSLLNFVKPFATGSTVRLRGRCQLSRTTLLTSPLLLAGISLRPERAQEVDLGRWR